MVSNFLEMVGILTIMGGMSACAVAAIMLIISATKKGTT